MEFEINKKKSFEFLILLINFSVFAIIIFSAIYYSNKGFELSDETFYLFNTNRFDTSIFISQNFGILNYLVCFGKATLIELRLAKLIYQSIAVVIFVFSLVRFLNYKKIEISTFQKWLLYLIALITSYINYDYLPMTLSYNTWSLILTLLASSIILYEISSQSKKTQLYCSILFGVILFCFFLSKFPNLFIVLASYLVFNFFLIKRFIPLKIFGVVIGLILGFILILHSTTDLYNIVLNYKAVIFDINYINSNTYYSQLCNLIEICFKNNFLLIEVLFFVSAFLIKKYVKSLIALLVLILVHTLTIGFYYKGNSHQLYNDFLAGSIILTNTIIFTFSQYKVIRAILNKKTNKDVFFLVLYLLLLPFGLMIGTNNVFYYTASQLMLFMVLGCFTAIIAFTNQFKNYFLVIITVLFSCFILSVCYFGAIINPYRQNNLNDKTTLLNYDNELSGIYENQATAIDFYSLKKITTHFNPKNKNVCLFFNHYGLIYTSGIEKILPPSILTDDENFISVNEYLLNRFNFANNVELLVLPETVEKSNLFKKMFSKFHVNLGQNYILKYKYKMMNTAETVYIYKKTDM